MHRSLPALILVGTASVVFSRAAASPRLPPIEGAGAIEGRIELTGKLPEMPELPRFFESGKPRDPACATHERARWVVTGPDGGVADVLVRLPVGAAKTALPAAVRVIDQKNCVYVPRVVAIMTGQQIAYRNSDATMHNIHAYLPDGKQDFNDAQPKGYHDRVAPLDVPAGPEPYRVTCDVHPWMEAFVMVTDHSYFTVTGADGRFHLDVPAGVYNLEAWHPNLGRRTVKVKVVPGKTVEAKFPPYRAADFRKP
jgi:plastocyanin